MAQLSRGRRLMGEINVVPYIDVMLVLLIIFMVTAPLLTLGVEVDLPRASAQPLESRDVEPVVLTIDAEGRMFLNVGDAPDRPLDRETIQARVAAALRRAPNTPVLVKASRRLAYGAVMEAMVLLQQAGAPKVGLVSDPLPEPRNPRS